MYAPNFFQSEFTLYHFSIYFNAVARVMEGETINRDFLSQYGFYPYLLFPIFKIISFSVKNFSFLMAIIYAAVLACIIFSIFCLIKRNILRIMAILSMVLLLGILQTNLYLQYSPHRMIFPALLIALISLYSRFHISIRIFKWKVVGFFLCSLSLIWNLETGIGVLITWLTYLQYVDFCDFSIMDKRVWRSLIGNVMMTFGSLLLSYGYIELCTWLICRESLPIKNIFEVISQFAGSMPLALNTAAALGAVKALMSASAALLSFGEALRPAA